MPWRDVRFLTLGAGLLPFLFGAPTAHADMTLTVGKGTCSVKSNSPSLRSGFITSSVTISCTVATTVVLEYGVVEMDGITEDSRVEVAFQKKTVAMLAGKSASITTATVACISTESSYEELATKSRISASGALTAWDRTSPTTDSYAC
ncbi:MAG: hypothetical protein ACKPDI_11585 [Actinomycetota bacterium]